MDEIARRIYNADEFIALHARSRGVVRDMLSAEVTAKTYALHNPGRLFSSCEDRMDPAAWQSAPAYLFDGFELWSVQKMDDGTTVQAMCLSSEELPLVNEWTRAGVVRQIMESVE